MAKVMENVMLEIDNVAWNYPFYPKFMDYVHPHEVVQDDRLSLTEKRTLLCAWASDLCAVESRPGFRWLPGTPGPILVDHIFAALRRLDDLGGGCGHAAYGASRASGLSGRAHSSETVGTIAH